MLAGEAVIAIWNGIAPEAREAFYEWHNNEHMPERVGIPGFRRGRRFIATAPDTHPEFFTLYETDTMEVVKGQGYANRLNDPTPATKTTTDQFRNTARALARVLESAGPGIGGAMLTIRFAADTDNVGGLRMLTRRLIGPHICGAHLCRADLDASGIRTAESRGRSDIEIPPAWFLMIEATGTDALEHCAPDSELTTAGAQGPFQRGLYRLEYLRTKTAFAQ